MSKLPRDPSKTIAAAAEAPETTAAPAADDAQAWAEAAMKRSQELEKLLRQVVLWFDSPLEAANDDHDTEILGAAVDLNRLIDRAIALLDGKAPPGATDEPEERDENQLAPAAPGALFVSPGLSSIN